MFIGKLDRTKTHGNFVSRTELTKTSASETKHSQATLETPTALCSLGHASRLGPHVWSPRCVELPSNSRAGPHVACITSPTSPGVLPASFLASALAAFVLCEQHRVGPMSPLTCTVHVARNRSRRLYPATNEHARGRAGQGRAGLPVLAAPFVISPVSPASQGSSSSSKPATGEARW